MKHPSLLALTATLGLLPLTACVISIGGTSCAVNAIQGSGVEATQTRQVGSFEKFAVSGSAEVVVRVGAERTVSIRGDDNLLDYVQTEVRGDTLHVGMQSGSYSFRRGLVIEVSNPVLAGLSISGSSDTKISGLDGGDFSVTVSGSGDVQASGRVDGLTAGISGSGSMELGELQARVASVKISGSGNMRVAAAESLDVRISGSGDVRYTGNPQVTQQVTGSGSVGQR